MPLWSRLLIVFAALGVAPVFSFPSSNDTDAAIAQAMGPPFYSGAILPAPKEAEFLHGHTVLLDGPAQTEHAAMSFPEDAALRELLERLWGQRIEAYRAQFGGSGWTAAHERMPVAFRLASEAADGIEGMEPALADRAAGLPPQGYVLDIGEHGAVGIGKDRAGLVNALVSFFQLTHVAEGRLVVDRARITDWPTFTVRYTSEYRMLGSEYFDWMMLYKINGFAASYRALDWRGLTEEQRGQLRAIGNYIERYDTLHFMAQLHLSGRAREGALMDSRNPKHREQLFETIRELLELGKTRHLWICYDDTHPELQPMEIEAGFTHPAQAHAALLEDIHAFVTGVCADAVVGWVPVPYQGRHHRRWRDDATQRDYDTTYLEVIRQWPVTEVPIVWTGPVTESRRIVVDDIEDYVSRIGPEKPLSYWDNTWHYHQPLRDFHAQYPDGFVDHCADSVSYINVNCALPIGQFFTVTATDYYWNPEAFDSKRSRRHAVAQFMGPEAVEPAERFYSLRGDGYWVHFAARVDLDAFARALEDIEAASWDAAIPQGAWHQFNLAAQAQDQPERVRKD